MLAVAHDRTPLPAGAVARPAASAAIIPEVNWFDGAAPAAAVAEPLSALERATPVIDATRPPEIAEQVAASAPSAAEVATPAPASEARTPEPPPNPLAALMALSEEERIALFT
jgi:hypothetical protein